MSGNRRVRIWEEAQRADGSSRLRSRHPRPLLLKYGLTQRGERQMESLALLASVILLATFGSGLIAFIASWFRNRVAEVATYIFSAISILAGCLLALSLWGGNGLIIGLFPVSFGVFGIWNHRRRKKLTSQLPSL